MIPFIRDRFTWLSYLMLGYYGYLQSCAGPAMPFLGTELNLSYTERGFHFSAFALGMVLAGLTTDRLARLLGRRLTFWIGSAGMAVGALFFIAGQAVLVTAFGQFIMGFVGTWMLIMIQATLADHHGEQRSIALTEANIFAGVTVTIAPLAISSLERVGIGWRGGILLPVIIWVILVAVFWQVKFPPNPAPRATGATGRLSGTFWIYWVIVVLVVSVEWCIGFWGADFLEKIVGLPKVDASGAMVAFFFAYVVGRSLGSRLARFYAVDTLLFAALGMAMVGFLLFWLPVAAPLNLLGLFISGIGVSNLFPLTLSAATRVAAEQANIASARISLGAGVAILIMPQLLGTAADNIGIKMAFAVVPLLLIGVLVVTAVASWYGRGQLVKQTSS